MVMLLEILMQQDIGSWPQHTNITNGAVTPGPGPGSDDIMLRSVVIIRLGLGNIL